MAQSSVAINGLNVTYAMSGQGPDVVFIHGWASSGRMWADFAARLAEHYRCWSLDLPGFGDSDKPDSGWYSIPNFTAVVGDFIRLKGMRHVCLVGHSMGGMIVLNLAARYPELIERLVAINPVVTGRARLRPLARRQQSRNVLGWVLRLSPVVNQSLRSPALGRRKFLRHLRRRTEDLGRCTTDSLLLSGRALVDFDVSPVLGRIAAPTLVILGDKDVNVPCSEGRLAASCIPGARVLTMRAGHLPTDDRPAEVLQHLQRFLA
jgi:pimeloyl-ACP methyl ester carboxylesterase